ncbi:uncharacterized protein LOC142328757 [Lycorma delicatula]|uniref:uncharacterized protein LOC142328757 n=1 Tax=Lycorma delicatula TaxID=130591 RepID=UPI003F516C33
MERSRVEDIKKKFECLQSESSVNNINVNKSPVNVSKNSDHALVINETSKHSELVNHNLKVSNCSNFVGRGNIKRSHAFRADKPIIRNFGNVGNDTSSLDTTDLCGNKELQQCSSGIISSVGLDGLEFKGKNSQDLKQKKYSNKKKDANINISNCTPNKLLDYSSHSVFDHAPSTSKYATKDIAKENIMTNEDVINTPCSPKETYSTVLKTRKGKHKKGGNTESEEKVHNKLDKSDSDSSAKKINLDNNKSKIAYTSPVVKSIVKSVEERNIKKQSNEKLKLDDKTSHSDISSVFLSNTLKAALSAPLPSGPPPKKPPRTFAHFVSKDVSRSSNDSSNTDIEKQCVLKTNSASGIRQNANSNDILNKPVRSKTESQIMLKKLENYLSNHLQNTNGNSKSFKKSKFSNLTVNDESKVDKQLSSALIKDNEIIESNFVSNNDRRLNVRISVDSQKSNNNNNNSNLCFNSLNCTKQPIYESPVLKKSNFFVTFPKRSSIDESETKCFTGKSVDDVRKLSYGTIKRSASEEHIYAEPDNSDDVINNISIQSMKLKCATISERRGMFADSNLRSHLNSLSLFKVEGDNKNSNVQSLRANFEQVSSNSKDCIDKEKTGQLQCGLHYMCTPINDSPGFIDRSKVTGSNPESQLIAVDDFITRRIKRGNAVNKKNQFINEAVNENVRLNTSPQLPFTLSSGNNTVDHSDPDQLTSSLSVVSDCLRPRNLRMTTLATEQTSCEIDKHRIHQLLSEAYGKIKHNNNSGATSSAASSGNGDVASGSDSDCSSVISSPDDPNQLLISAEAAASTPFVTNSSGGSGVMSMKNSKDREQITAERKGYVRRVSRRLTSVRSPHPTPARFKHLFECLLLVGLDLNSARCKVPYIKNKFPENVSSPAGIESLCFPDADDWPPSPDSGQSYIQILTDSNGIRKYSYCRRVQPEDAVICLPLAYCIITPFKSNTFYNKILIDLESMHGHLSDTELLKFVQQLYDCPFPAPGQNLSVQQQMTLNECNFMLDVYKRPLELREEDTELVQLLNTIKLSIFLQMFATLLHERKLILVSDSISKLSVCIEGLQFALYPFHWQHTVVPVLPSVLMDICEAPTPYLIGIIKPKLSDIPFNNLDLDLVVDIDDGIILNSKGDEGWILPSRLSRGLRSALQLSIQASQSSLNTANLLASEAIIRLFIELVGHYRDHISISSDTRKREFQRETFVRNGSSRSIQLFLEWFTETAMFNAFIESRVERKSESRGLFEQRCSEYIEENGHPIIKNYKAINKTVKTLGDRFKDWAAL